MNKPFSVSCEQNQQVILDQLTTLFIEPGEVLEIGSGTGQHAVFFTQHLQHLKWQPSDLASQLTGMKLWLEEADHKRIKSPMILDVDMPSWPLMNTDYIFTANTTHIISISQTEKLFKHVGAILKIGGLFVQYGPFNYNGKYTSESNEQFDSWLKQRNALSGIKQFETLQNLAQVETMDIINDIAMPTNNRLLVWQKKFDL